MTKSKKCEFTCSECGSHELGYQKFVKCVTPVTIKEDGHSVYGRSKYDDDDWVAGENGFCCLSCGKLIWHCGWNMEDERMLLQFLQMPLEIRQQEEEEYANRGTAEAEYYEQQNNAPPPWLGDTHAVPNQ